MMYLLPLIIFITSNIFCQNYEYYDLTTRAIYRLEKRNTHESVGTAFAIRYNNKRYLITARHVAENNFDLRARVKVINTITQLDEFLELRIPKSSWIFHPNEPNIKIMGTDTTSYNGVDIAITPLPNIIDRKIASYYSCSICEDGKRNVLSLRDPNPPLTVQVIGFPKYVGYELKEQRPIFRSGIVAFTADEPFIRETKSNAYFDKNVFMIDGHVFGGNSGGPVIHTEINGNVTLVGIVIATVEKYNYAIAEPASRIRELLEFANNQNKLITPEWYKVFDW